MAGELDLEGLAHRLALIASGTSDSEAGRRLLAVVEELLEQAGLPTSGMGSDASASGWVFNIVGRPS
jgi:hypothetical protein